MDGDGERKPPVSAKEETSEEAGDSMPGATAETSITIKDVVPVKPAVREDAVEEKNDAGEGEKESQDNQRPWDNTNRKVMVYNVKLYLKAKEMNKMATKWVKDMNEKQGTSVAFTKIKKPPKGTWVQITMKEESMVEPFIEYINSSGFTNSKGRHLQASKAVDEDRNNKRDRDSDPSSEHQESNKRQRLEQKPKKPPTLEQVKDAIIPLWNMDYDTQLRTKQRTLIKKSAIKIVQEIKAKFRLLERQSRQNRNRKAVPLYNWLAKKRDTIHLKEMLPTNPYQYRNKCEFTFGYRLQSKATNNDAQQTDESTIEYERIPSVGFMTRGWAGCVSRPHGCPNIPSEAIAVLDCVDAFLSTSSIPVYESLTHRGVWRLLTVRSSRRTKQCMVVIQHAPPTGGAGAKDESDDYSHLFVAEQERLIQLLRNAELPIQPQTSATSATATDEKVATMRITSIYFQEYDGLSIPPPEHPVQHVFGDLALQENLGKCTFQISPGAFFQVNTSGAETLYNVVVKKVREVAKDPTNTLLLDVCCGTGTIGLVCMKEGAVGRVVGVDISAPAIEDAKRNAELNGFSQESTRFVASRAELVLGDELAKVRDEKSQAIVAVVDPAREGLHSDVVRALRSNRQIQRIVYVSCNPTGSLIKDSVMLCSPPTKQYRGEAFQPTSGQPVDMFPWTDHCELVMTFDRLDENGALLVDDRTTEKVSSPAPPMQQPYEEKSASATTAAKEDDKPTNAKTEDRAPTT